MWFLTGYIAVSLDIILYFTLQEFLHLIFFNFSDDSLPLTDKMDVFSVTVNVSGQVFEVKRNTWEKMTESRSSDSNSSSLVDGNKIFLVGNSRCFGQILKYFYGRGLHMPKDVCPLEFEEELQYWGLEKSTVSKCCRGQLSSFYEEQQTIAKFDKYTTPNIRNYIPSGNVGLKKWLHDIKYKMWIATEKPDSSIWAKVRYHHKTI